MSFRRKRGGSIARPCSSLTCRTALTMIDARADGEHFAAELAAHQDFENFAGLDSVDRHADEDATRKMGREYFFQVEAQERFVGCGVGPSRGSAGPAGRGRCFC